MTVQVGLRLYLEMKKEGLELGLGGDYNLNDSHHEFVSLAELERNRSIVHVHSITILHSTYY